MIHNIPQAAIYGICGTVLADRERSFFQRVNPLGFILFARNCENPDQVRALVKDLKCTVQHDSPLVLIDQEGGRVSRLNPPHWKKFPPAEMFRKMAETDLDTAEKAVYDNYQEIADLLRVLGIQVNCAPVLDLLFEGYHDIVGDRAFGCDSETVIALGRQACRGMLDGGVLPVIKHIPGHGRAKVDSHESLPVVDAPLHELVQNDFSPFAALADMPLAMTAHITYTAVDGNNPATLSHKVIELIRRDIGFDGLLLTDDLSMRALKGSFTERAKSSLAAGCDVVLHCNGNMQEMEEIAAATPALNESGAARFGRALSFLKIPQSAI